MDTATAARAVQGQLHGENVGFTRVATDTRTLAPGDLYVAIKGERFDGHDFVGVAFERGAAAALVAADHANALSGNLIAVQNSVTALGALAAHWRAQFSIPVIAIVGSNGKTTVKEMLATILRTHFGDAHVLATAGNFNNAIGLPLTLLKLNAGHQVAAIEVGMNHPGETAELGAIASPSVAVINNAQREHQEFMQSIAEVAEEHAALLRALRRGGTAVLNADDPSVDVWRAAARDRRDIQVVEFALEHSAATQLRGSVPPPGEPLEVSTPQGNTTIRLNAPGRHSVANALAAATAALAIGVPLSAISAGLESFRPVAGRLATRRAMSGATVLDDTYNANPDSVRAAIDVLAPMPAPRWLVLGDMGEVGANGPGFHREVGEYARLARIDRLLAVGVLAAESAAAFGPGAEHFASVEALATRVTRTAVAGTTVLVKGSRFMRMERVVSAMCGPAVPAGAH